MDELVEKGVLNWLLGEDQPAVRYRAAVDLLGQPESGETARSALSGLYKRGWVPEILSFQRPGGHWETSRDLYLPKYTATNWRMIVLSDLGATADDSRIRSACDLFFSDWLGDEKKFLDEGEVCVVGNLARTLTRCGYGDDPRVRRLFDWLVADQKEDGGWHCFKSDTGTLDCWEALAAFASLPREKWTGKVKRSAENGIEFYLERQMFREGPRYVPWFRFHYPVHYYYDLLVGLDTVTALGCGRDKRLEPSLEILKKKRRRDGTWSLDAVHPDIGRGAAYSLRRAAKPFALERVGESSKIITLKAMQVLSRLGERA